MASLLLTPGKIGPLHLTNRLVMAPMTRLRASDDGVPTPLMVEYYQQRAAAGLIVTECTMVSPMSHGYMHCPGIYSQPQIDAWHLVTEAVHQAGGHIFLQLWHSGRVSHPALLDGTLPVAPSALAAEGELHTPAGKQGLVVPRALAVHEIAEIVVQFTNAAQAGQMAGFDGIELHGAFGYLIDQFLHDGSNQRRDAYGGSIEHRVRFLREILNSVLSVWDVNRVGIKLSPSNTFYGMRDSDPRALFGYVLEMLDTYQLAYVHIMQPNEVDLAAGVPIRDTITFARQHYEGALIANGGYTRDSGDAALRAGKMDLVSYARLFIANPDLPQRFARDAQLNASDPRTWYGHGADSAVGYTDYPCLAGGS